jgi:hypothetical protein
MFLLASFLPIRSRRIAPRADVVDGGHSIPFLVSERIALPNYCVIETYFLPLRQWYAPCISVRMPAPACCILNP